MIMLKSTLPRATLSQKRLQRVSHRQVRAADATPSDCGCHESRQLRRRSLDRLDIEAQRETDESARDEPPGRESGRTQAARRLRLQHG
jgi:hypothetical protein